MQRDKYINEQLNAKGYTVMRFWEHEVKENLAKCVGIALYRGCKNSRYTTLG